MVLRVVLHFIHLGDLEAILVGLMHITPLLTGDNEDGVHKHFCFLLFIFMDWWILVHGNDVVSAVCEKEANHSVLLRLLIVCRRTDEETITIGDPV